jgi:subtilase family serine protease
MGVGHLFSALFVVLTGVLKLVAVHGDHVKMETKIPRQNLHQLGRAKGDTRHEVVFAVHQNNMDILERMVAERSTPGSSYYQQWMTFDEVGALISNPVGTVSILEWLGQYPLVDVTWKSKRGEYIKASAPLSVWEGLFATEYYEWQDTHEGQARKHHLADHYSLPEHLKQHVSAVFGTVQVPPIVNSARRSKKQDVFKTKLRVNKPSAMTSQAASGVTVSFLDSFYNIPSNIGSNYIASSCDVHADLQ